MFKYDYKYAILLDRLRNVEDFIYFWIWIHYIQGGGVNHPDIFTSNIPYIQNVYIALLSFAIAYMQCINLKGNMLNKKQWMNVGSVFSIIPRLI